MKAFRLSILVLALISVASLLLAHRAHADTVAQSVPGTAYGTTYFRSGSFSGAAVPEAQGVTPRAHFVIRGGYVAAGVGIRDTGYGTVAISGIPASSKVIRAFLYWDILADKVDPSLGQANFNGTAITGDVVGQGGDPCWGSGGNFAYRADVTKLVKGNGNYKLTGFSSFYTDNGSPFDESGPDWPPTVPMAEGATLVVIYTNKKAPITDIVLVEGSDEFSSAYSLTVNGFLAANPVKSASYTSFGADGQTVPTCAAGKEIYLNNTLLSTTDWDGSPNPNELWDTHTHDVTALIKPGDQSATISYPGNTCDCLIWNGAIIAVSAADSDGDGLPDAWEINGYDDPDTGKHVDLPGMGANPMHKDLFVQLDWMNGTYNQKPNPKAIAKIIKAFKSAPEPNPDGKNGINLHVDYGQGGLYNKGTAIPYQDVLPGVIEDDWSAFDDIKNNPAYFPPERMPIFHFGVFAHDIDGQGTSGIARGIPDVDFVVSLGEWTNHVGSLQEQAGTFMHELGHTINLHHGGGDDINYKPNRLSVMNYFFQTRGLRKNGKDGLFDYSRFLLPALDETNLDKTVGLDGGPSINAYGTRYFCADVNNVVNKANGPIDWNCDGKDNEKVAADINDDYQLSLLTGFQDWDNLDFRGCGLIGTPDAVRVPCTGTPEGELTVGEDSKVQPSPPSNVAQHNGTISWTPVGLEIIKAYKVYQVGPGGKRTLVKVVPSDEAAEEGDQISISLPGHVGANYVVTSVDRYGNESGVSSQDD